MGRCGDTTIAPNSLGMALQWCRGFSKWSARNVRCKENSKFSIDFSNLVFFLFRISNHITPRTLRRLNFLYHHPMGLVFKYIETVVSLLIIIPSSLPISHVSPKSISYFIRRLFTKIFFPSFSTKFINFNLTWFANKSTKRNTDTNTDK